MLAAVIALSLCFLYVFLFITTYFDLIPVIPFVGISYYRNRTAPTPESPADSDESAGLSAFFCMQGFLFAL